MADTADPTTSAQTGAPEEAPLPKLSAAEFRQYNHMAEHMDMFHNNFRQAWTILYDAATKNQKPSGMSNRQILGTGLQFCSHLEMHHNIEEAHIFPVLAKKMPKFKKASAEHGEMIRQHKVIHAGLEKLQDWLQQVQYGERDLVYPELKEVMDTFGDTLWKHLDAEVKELGAENMRKFWTLEEMRRMPM